MRLTNILPKTKQSLYISAQFLCWIWECQRLDLLLTTACLLRWLTQRSIAKIMQQNNSDKSDNISTQQLFLQGKLLFLLVWSQQYFYYISRKALQYDTWSPAEQFNVITAKSNKLCHKNIKCSSRIQNFIFRNELRMLENDKCLPACSKIFQQNK